MKYLYIIVLIYIFINSWKYGIYELKENKNKPAGISIFLISLLRVYISTNIFNYKLLIKHLDFHFQKD